MGCFEECCDYICEPYGGNMPLFRKDQTDATVTIVQEAYDDGMKVTKIQTPPRTESSKLIDAINYVLGMVGDMDLFKDQKSQTKEKDGQKSSDKSDKDDDELDKEDGEKDDFLRSESESEESKQDSGFPGKKRGFGQAD